MGLLWPLNHVFSYCTFFISCSVITLVFPSGSVSAKIFIVLTLSLWVLALRFRKFCPIKLQRTLPLSDSSESVVSVICQDEDQFFIISLTACVPWNFSYFRLTLILTWTYWVWSICKIWKVVPSSSLKYTGFHLALGKGAGINMSNCSIPSYFCCLNNE